MSILPIWDEIITVKPYETDFQRKWKPHCFFQSMQQAATNHATHLGLGYHAMLKNDTVWLLARLKIKFERIPNLGENVRVQTWPRSLQQKIFFMRDFKMFDADDHTLAAATSAWLLVDVRERRILKPEPGLLDHLPDNSQRVALQETIDKIAVPQEMDEQFKVDARYSVIDLMQHVNNARYIEWSSDCFPLDYHRQRQPDWIQINYASEVKPGEQVSIQKGQQDETCYVISGENLNSGERAFEVVWCWK